MSMLHHSAPSQPWFWICTLTLYGIPSGNANKHCPRHLGSYSWLLYILNCNDFAMYEVFCLLKIVVNYGKKTQSFPTIIPRHKNVKLIVWIVLNFLNWYLRLFTVALACSPVAWELTIIEARGFRTTLDYMRPHAKNKIKITIVLVVVWSLIK